MNKKTQTPETEALLKALVSLETVEECSAFLDDLCTVAEVQEMGRRLKAAKMLASGAKYAEVGEATGLSTATISRVSRALKYGADGYTSILKKLGSD